MAESTALTERILVLRSLPYFSSLPSAEVTSIARTMRPHVYAKGDVILKEEDPPRSVHVITSGTVGIWRRGHHFGSLGPPEAVGFMPLVARLPDQFGVIAETHVTTLEADADAVFELLEEQFELVITSMRDTAKRLLLEMQRGSKALLTRLGAPPVDVLPIERTDLFERPLDIVERIFFLRRMRPFRNSNIDALAVLSRSFEEVRVQPGETIWRIGDPSGTLLLVATGRLHTRDAQGNQLATFASSAVIGGFESMAGERRWYDLVADTPVMALRGKSDAMLEVFEDNHDMARDFLAMSTSTLMSLWDERIAAGDPPDSVLRGLLSSVSPRR